MKRAFWVIIFIFVCVNLVGCSKWIVRTSVSEKPRVDQEVSGNRGFISGQATTPVKEPTFTKRKVYQVEVEMPQLFQKEKPAIVQKKPAKRRPRKDTAVWGNKGYIFGGPKKEAAEEPPLTDVEVQEEISQEVESEPQGPTKMRTYQVRKGDTLQKISRQFYGTTKKWPLLYEANRDKLTGPDKIKPGQILVIPEVGAFKK